MRAEDALTMIDVHRCFGDWFGDKEKNDIFTRWIKIVKKELDLKYVIKRKKVNFIYLLKSDTVEDYNRHFKRKIRQLTDEEFRMISEVYKEYETQSSQENQRCRTSE